MRILGLTIGEIAAVIGLLGGAFSVIMYLLKAIVISPLNTAIEQLQASIDNFSNKSDKNEQEINLVNHRINKIDKRVTVLEEHDKWEENNKK